MNLGAPEILVILVVALLVFGPHRLPEIGRQVGGAMRELRKMQDSVKSELHSVMNDTDTSPPSYDKSVAAQPDAVIDVAPTEVHASALDEEPDHTDAEATVSPEPEPSSNGTSHATGPTSDDAGFDGPAGSFL
jgi:sec-independent protein translocase protein TatA